MTRSPPPYDMICRDGDQYLRVAINGEVYDVEYSGHGRVTVPRAIREDMDAETRKELNTILASNRFTVRYGNPDSAS